MMRDSAFGMRDTICGTLLGIVANITSAELINTVILAAVGAVVSYVVSALLHRWWKTKR